jgi:hypothetical protein
MSELREKATVKRFDKTHARDCGGGCRGAMEEDSDGNYVRWEDYETAEQQRDEARELLQKVGMHLDELSDAWKRGALVSQDGKNGLRSNVNNDLLMAVDKFLLAPPAADAPQLHHLCGSTASRLGGH